MKRILFLMAVIFANPNFGFAQDNMRSVPKSALLEGEVIGSHATPTDAPLFPNFAVLLRHREYGLIHCNIVVKKVSKAGWPYERIYSCATFE